MLARELDLKTCLYTKIQLSRPGLAKVENYRQTDATEDITMPHSLVLKTVEHWGWCHPERQLMGVTLFFFLEKSDNLF